MADEDDREPVFKNVEEFMVEYFLPVFRRPFPHEEIRWCAEWWKHAEARSRLHALWHAWEVMRWEPGTGMAKWYQDHLDPMLERLLSPTGPFHSCTPEEHREPMELPSVSAPEGFFEEEW